MSQKLVSISLESKRLAEEAIAFEEAIGKEKEEQLQVYYSRLIDQLLFDGFKPSEVYEVGKKILIDIKVRQTGVPPNEINTSWFWKVCRKKIGETTQNESDFLGNSSIYTTFEEVITRLERVKILCEDGIEKFKVLNQKCKDEEIDQTRFYDQEHLKEFLSQWDQFLQMAEDGFNEKTKIPQHTQLILLYHLATASSVTNGAKIFMKARLELMEEIGKFLTAKQAGKFQTGDISDQLPILKPYSRDTAIFLRCWGVQCPKCNSWCVKDFAQGDKTKLKCIDCENIFDPVTISKCRVCQIPLYKEDLLYIIENKKCKNCMEAVYLPQELVDYAHS